MVYSFVNPVNQTELGGLVAKEQEMRTTAAFQARSLNFQDSTDSF
jgi:hypothetical protein